MIDTESYDLAVVGGGIGGLALASLAQRSGLKTILCESHTKLGGCAGYFERGPYTFDCGATALMGTASGEPIRELLDRVGASLETVRTPAYRMCLPDGDFVLTDDVEAWETAFRQRFPHLGDAPARFWRIQRRIGEALFEASSKLPRSPLRRPGDILHNLRILGIAGTLSTMTTAVTVYDLLRVMGLHRDKKFVAIVAMLLQDTAQAGPETVPLANAAACLQAYRLGLSRPVGSMKAFAEGLGEAFAGWGGELRKATLVDSVRPNDVDSSYRIKTRRGETLIARHVAMNMPLDKAMGLLGDDFANARLKRFEARSRAGWSAFTTYAAVDAAAIEGQSGLFHHILQDYDQPIHDGNNVLISLSPEGDDVYGPHDVRTLTMSTHVDPEQWSGLSKEAYAAKKAEYAQRMQRALSRAFPGVESATRHLESATPRSFARYTRRSLGRVGGPPVSRSRSNLMAVDPGVFGKRLWIVGDSVFPGQGTMAVVMCAMRILERITGRPWKDDVQPIEQSTNVPTEPVALKS